MNWTPAQFIAHLAKHQKPGDKPPPSKSERAEDEIQEEIEDYLKSLGTECYYIRHRMDEPTTCRTGVADFIGWYRGRPFSLEVKVPGKKTPPDQLGELAWARQAGAIARTVYSVEDVVAELQQRKAH
jgi:hypothetical protein